MRNRSGGIDRQARSSHDRLLDEQMESDPVHDDRLDNTDLWLP